MTDTSSLGRLTPLDLRHQEFSGALSGYSRRQVRAFLERASEDLEALLRERQHMQQHCAELERRIEEYRATEDELRRTVIAAERIGNELKQNAQREAELTLQSAQERASGLDSETQARREALEADHRARMADLEGRQRERLHRLDSHFQARHNELERVFTSRLAELETAFAHRHGEWAAALARLQSEHAQFLTQHRALVAGYFELAQRHPLPEGDLDFAPPALQADAALPSSEPPDPDAPPRVEEQQFM